jgi:hypothetical protein
MAFEPLNDSKLLNDSFEGLMGTGVTATRFKLLKYSSGYFVNAADGDDEAEYLALETKTNSGADGAAVVQVVSLNSNPKFKALCSTTPVQATHVGNDYDLDDDAIVKLSSTTDKVFHVDYIYDAANSIVVGHFNTPAIA